MGGVTFTVPESAVETVDDGQGNIETKLTVLVREGGVFGAPASKGSMPPNSTLLPNYSNPVNPETWIPYRLAKPADVTLIIFNMRGVVVRQLALGHQRIGFYYSRSGAAYWDGKNEFGESVASGVYSYMLTADNFSATRKMLICK